MSVIGAVELIAKIDTSAYTSGVRTLEKANSDLEKSSANSTKSTANSFKTFASNTSSSFGTVADSISGFMRTSALALAGGSLGIMTFVKQASDLQGIKASFESMTGSAAEAERVLSQLNEFSFKTAFSTSDINAAARTLLGAGLEVGELGSRMGQLGDIAGATGANLGQLTLPISQAMSRGKLQTQDYYQILNSGAGKLGQVLREEVAARGLGSMDDALSNGLVTTELLFASMEKANSEGGFAFQGAIKQSLTFDGQMSNLMETVGGVGLELLGVEKATGKVDQNGVFAKMSKAVQDATKWLGENKESIKTVVNILINNAIPAVTALTAAFVAMKVVSIVMGIISAPILLIPIAIAAVVAAIAWLLVTNEDFRNGVIGVWNTIVSYFTGVASVFVTVFSGAWGIITSVWNGAAGFFSGVWNGITGAFGAVGSWFQTTFSNAWAGVKSVFAAGGTVFAGIQDGISGIFKTVVNGLIGGINAVIATPFNAINGALNTIKKIDILGNKPFGGLPTIPVPQIPKLATGGVINSATLALIGENGREAVMPLERNTGWIDELASKLNRSGGAGITQNNNIYNQVDLNAVSRQLAWQVAR